MLKARRIAGWFLTIVGILWAVYGGAQVVLGLILAMKSPHETGHLAGAASGTALFAAAALVTWGGRRLRTAAGRASAPRGR